MYLKNFSIKNFRSIKSISFEFNKGLNVIIGENNSGKTAVIDALRICFSYGNQWRDIYIRKDDFHIDRNNYNAVSQPIEFDLVFQIEKEEETGIFYDLLVQGENGEQTLELHFYYYLVGKNGNEKVKWKVWGGENEGQSITPEVLDLINFVYLDPLRDAVDKLKPVRWNKLGELFANIEFDSENNKIDNEKRKELAEKVTSFFREENDWKKLIKSGEKKLNEHLNQITIENKIQQISIDFLPFEFRKIVDNLRIQIPIYQNSKDENKQKYFQLYQNGLGHNNLIYTATILGDLINKKDVEPEAYFSLLIEEPEAHLHPQLQNIFFNYMNKLNEKGIQLFITSHSPTITAKVQLDSLIVLQSQQSEITSLSLKNSALSEDNKKYLAKFLDVTKSQLFFSNGTILVEGISEALLLPVFSRIMGDEYDIERAGIEVVNIGGVAFEHFARLYNSDDSSKRLPSKCAIITDDDRDTKTGESRAKKAKDLGKNNLKVFLGEITFEYELFVAGNGNEKLITEIYKEMHSNTVLAGNCIEDKAKDFIKKLKSNKDKSEFAHRLSIKLEDSEELRKKFIIPDYIKKAIKWVVKGE